MKGNRLKQPFGLPSTRSSAAHQRNPSFSLLVSVSSMAIFGLLAASIESGLLLELEESVLLGLHQYATPAKDASAIAICASVTGVSIAALLYLCCRRRWNDALFWLSAVGGAAILGNIVKRAVERSRPELWDALHMRHNFSFPSGHATHAMAILLTTLILFGPSRLRIPLAIAGTLYVCLVGLCRVYLGLHYPTDVLGGWSLSVAWVGVLALLRKLLDRDVATRALPPGLAETP